MEAGNAVITNYRRWLQMLKSRIFAADCGVNRIGQRGIGRSIIDMY
jgi:hypothetical protein